MCFCKKSEKPYAGIVTELEAKRKEGVSDFFADLNKLTVKARAKRDYAYWLRQRKSLFLLTLNF